MLGWLESGDAKSSSANKPAAGASLEHGIHELKAFLGEGTEFTGFLTFKGTVRIDGKFDGEINTEHNLIIGKNATVRAEIGAGAVLVKGKFYGNITATEKIEISDTGKLYGNISTKTFIVENGALFEGNCHMVRKQSDTGENTDTQDSTLTDSSDAEKLVMQEIADRREQNKQQASDSQKPKSASN